jgi:uncharacterized MAPEG superfamily protein
MSQDVAYLVASAILTWVSVLAASLIRVRGWTVPGFVLALGNRDSLPDPTALAGRADRAARNMLENLVLFIAVLAAVHFAGVAGDLTDLGAAVFFWSRLAFWFAYLAGIVYLRTLLWAGGVAGMAMILVELFQAQPI